MSSAASILVNPPANASITREKQDHWKGEAASSGFFNPWKSAAPKPAFWPMFKFVRELNSMSANDPDVQNIASLVPWQKPDFGATLPHDQLKLTWLSHASFLAQMPSKGPSPKERGVNILFDPAYSKRCSPSQYFGGNVRMQPPPATPEELPEVDMVMISHNHYDHCDINTLQAIFSKNQERPPLLFVGLNGAANLRSTVGASTQIIEMDWWETREVDVAGRGKVKVHCTPCQHTCQRSLFDLDKNLWASWAVQEVKEDGQIGASIWHAGDTGYCHVNEETHTIDPSLPTCPAFKEIGQKYGPFTATMIPIGAYAPRHLMSTNHNAPIDAVRMFKDVQAKNAIAMHWGTWRMAHDRVAEPPEKLVDARKEVGLRDDEFIVVGLGETKGYDV